MCDRPDLNCEKYKDEIKKAVSGKPISGTVGIKDHVPDKRTMASEEGEIFFRTFEPKLNNRHIVYMERVPSYLIYKVTRPLISTDEEGNYIYGNLILELYDPIVPSTSQIFTDFQREKKSTFDEIIFKMLGPIGDIVEQWIYKNCKIKTIEYSQSDWSNDKPSSIKVTLSFKEAIHEF